LSTSANPLKQKNFLKVVRSQEKQKKITAKEHIEHKEKKKKTANARQDNRIDRIFLTTYQLIPLLSCYPVKKTGFPLPDRVEDKLRGNDTGDIGYWALVLQWALGIWALGIFSSFGIRH